MFTFEIITDQKICKIKTSLWYYTLSTKIVTYIAIKDKQKIHIEFISIVLLLRAQMCVPWTQNKAVVLTTWLCLNGANL